MPSADVMNLGAGQGGQARGTAAPAVIDSRARHGGHNMPTRVTTRSRRALTSFRSRGFSDIGLSRFDFARSLDTFNGNRNLDRALGRVEPGHILLEDYLHLYQRGGIAGMLIDKLVNTALRSGADILEGDGNEQRANISRWEKDIAALFKRTHAWEVLKEGIIESRKSHFAIILIGAATAGEIPSPLDEPLDRVPGGIDGISFLRAYGEASMTSPTSELVKDMSSPWFGYPEFYRVKLSRNVGSRKIHRSRIIHISNSLGPWGTPILDRRFVARRFPLVCR